MFGTVSKWIGVYNIWYYGVFMALNGKLIACEVLPSCSTDIFNAFSCYKPSLLNQMTFCGVYISLIFAYYLVA